MTENNEYEATPNEAVVDEALKQAEAERTAVFDELQNLDYGFRYQNKDGANIDLLRHTVAVLKTRLEARRALEKSIDEWVSGMKERYGYTFDDDVIALLDILEDALSLDAYENKSIDIEISATVYVSRKKWEADEDIDIDNISVSLEGNYGFEIDDYSIDSIREG